MVHFKIQSVKMKKKLELNNYLKFLPLLVIYLIICLIKQKNIMVGDEGRYLDYAYKLLNGTYASSNDAEYSFLWNGPDYPIFLIPFVYFKTSLLIPKLFNVLFLYFGIFYFHKSLVLFISTQKALILSFILGLYYPLLMESLPKILTEGISFFLASMFTFYSLLYLKKKEQKIHCSHHLH